MRVEILRSFEAIKPVLMDPNCIGIDPVYQVYTDLNDPHWVNRTEIYPGKLGQEFPKTFGHYHGVDVNETSHVVSGSGVLILQKKHAQDGVIVSDIVDEVFLIKAFGGEEIVVTPEWGHSWSNVGNAPLVIFDDWQHRDNSTKYEMIQQMQGMSYYIVDEGGQVKEVANQNYKNLPKANWITVQQFREMVTGTTK